MFHRFIGIGTYLRGTTQIGLSRPTGWQ